ncbi:hypothetical protein [Arthrobacter sp. zg-Y769]|uniref:hypothetical protein n=1 Tax=Arthrobacter sp. zg-Y769 TaxID=2894191 RepID=UPI002F42D4D6
MTEEPVTGKAAAEEAAAAGAPEQGTPAGAPEQGTPAGAPRGGRRRGNRRAVSSGAGGQAGLLPVTAKEDDPRAWGDSPEDTDSWLREQRPPHWG